MEAEAAVAAKAAAGQQRKVQEAEAAEQKPEAEAVTVAPERVPSMGGGAVSSRSTTALSSRMLTLSAAAVLVAVAFAVAFAPKESLDKVKVVASTLVRSAYNSLMDTGQRILTILS